MSTSVVSKVTPVTGVSANWRDPGVAESKLKIVFAVVNPKMVSASHTDGATAMKPERIRAESFIKMQCSGWGLMFVRELKPNLNDRFCARFFIKTLGLRPRRSWANLRTQQQGDR